jgi:hypothetical protein
MSLRATRQFRKLVGTPLRADVWRMKGVFDALLAVRRFAPPLQQVDVDPQLVADACDDKIPEIWQEPFSRRCLERYVNSAACSG